MPASWAAGHADLVLAWSSFGGLFVLGCVVFFRSLLSAALKTTCEGCTGKAREQDSVSARRAAVNSPAVHAFGSLCFRSHHITREVEALERFREELDESGVFTSHVRTESNFVRDNDDQELVLPPTCPPERASQTFSTIVLYQLLLGSPAVRSALLDALGAALIAGSFCSITWLLKLSGGSVALEFIVVAQEQSSTLVSSFNFFPTFLMLGLLTFTANRWREQLVNCHSVQGRIQDIGITIGGAITNPEDPATRELLYQLYRYLNAVHALTYASVHPKITMTLNDYVPLGLLTPSEVSQLLPDSKVRDTLIAWTGSVLERFIREGRVRELAVGNMMIAKLRAICAEHHDLLLRNMPNTWFAVAKLLVDYMVWINLWNLSLDVTSDADAYFSDFSESDRRSGLVLFIALTTFNGFLESSCYWLAWAMVQVLSNPFSAGYDSYSSDALIASTERQLFAVLRSTFATTARSSSDSPPSGRASQSNKVAVG